MNLNEIKKTKKLISCKINENLLNDIDKIRKKEKIKRTDLIEFLLRDFVEKYKKDNFGGF